MWLAPRELGRCLISAPLLSVIANVGYTKAVLNFASVWWETYSIDVLWFSGVHELDPCELYVCYNSKYKQKQLIYCVVNDCTWLSITLKVIYVIKSAKEIKNYCNLRSRIRYLGSFYFVWFQVHFSLWFIGVFVYFWKSEHFIYYQCAN